MLSNRFPALKSRSFVIFFIGQFLSLVGTWMQSTVQPYLAYNLTNQPFDLGLVGFAGTLPAMLVTLPGGVIIENLDKRKTVIALQAVMMLQAFTMAILTLTGSIALWHIIILAFILGTANSLEITARQSMFIELVGREALPNAIALNSSLFNAARAIGPALSVPFLLLLKDAGMGWAFFANGISYSFVIIGLLSIRTESRTQPSKGPRFSISKMLEGLRFIRQDRVIFSLISMVAILSIFGVPFIQQIPVFAKDVLSTSLDSPDAAATRNSLMISFQGIGALIAAIILATFSSNRYKGLILMTGQFLFAFALIGVSATKNAEFAYLLMGLAGFGLVSQMTLTTTMIQQRVPDDLRGRVIAAYLWVLQGTTPVGSLLIGSLAQSMGAPIALMLSGSICILLYALIHIKKPFIRNLRA